MLTSRQNPLVKRFRTLHRSKERKRQKMVLLEGTHLIMEACAARHPLVAVCATPDWQATHGSLWQMILDLSHRTELVADAVMQSMATTVEPDGVVAIASHALYGESQDNGGGSQVNRGESQDEVLPLVGDEDSGSAFLGVAVEELQDPGNLGTIIRTSAAVEANRLWVSQNSVDPTHPKVLRASAGQWFRLPMTVCSDVGQAIEGIQASLNNPVDPSQAESSLQVIATCPDTELSYWDVDYTLPSLILVGNEGAGLSSSLIQKATKRVQIPLSSDVESLNAAIATALVLYEAKRQRRIT